MTGDTIRVLHLLQSLRLGGTERRVLRLGLGLEPRNFDIHAITLRPAEGTPLPWPPERLTFFPIPSGVHLDRLAALARFIRQGRFDVVHTHNWATMFYGILAGRLARVPIILHGEHGRNDADRVDIPWKRELMAGILARMATRVVAVNESIGEDVRARWRLDPRRIVCVPNGVDVSRFAPRAAPGSGRAEFVIGTVGRFDAIKNLPCLIRAFDRVHRERPELGARLVLVGVGPALEAMRGLAQRVEASARIEFAGETDAPERWYPRFDLFANTSFSEGMSNAVLEGMACGLPVVASDIAGNRCWLREDVNALFFPSDDDAALAREIVRFASDRDLGHRMGQENRRRVLADYDNRGFLRRYEALYRELLAPN